MEPKTVYFLIFSLRGGSKNGNQIWFQKWEPNLVPQLKTAHGPEIWFPILEPNCVPTFGTTCLAVSLFGPGPEASF